MKPLMYLAGAAALALGGPASAALIINNYALSFAAGTAFVLPTPATAPGEYRDTFSFTTSEAMTFSGSLVTQRQTSPNGAIVSDLDFGNSVLPDGVHLDDIYFSVASGGLDTLEVQNLPSTLIMPGLHILTVNYTVQAASDTSAATYAGSVNLAAAGGSNIPVPEPAGWALLTLGFGAIGLLARRQQRPATARVSFC